MKPFSFHELVGELRSTLETFPDPRTGKNRALRHHLGRV